MVIKHIPLHYYNITIITPKKITNFTPSYNLITSFHSYFYYLFKNEFFIYTSFNPDPI